MTRLRPGDCPHLMTVQTVTKVSNSSGGKTEVVTATTTINGRIVPQKGSEEKVADRTEARRTLTVETFYRAGLTSMNRLLFGARRFRITAVTTPDELAYRDRMYLECEEAPIA